MHDHSPSKGIFFCIPLIVITLQNVWDGVTMHYAAMGTVCFIIKILCVGFPEELIFRGFRFKAMSRDSIKWVVVISSVTFGPVHIINLLNGTGMPYCEVAALARILLPEMQSFFESEEGQREYAERRQRGRPSKRTRYSERREHLKRCSRLCMNYSVYQKTLIKNMP